MGFDHTPVMPDKVRRHLNLKPGDICVDGTMGGCGHAFKMAESVFPTGRLICIDQDMDAITHGRQKLKPFGSSVTVFHDNFSNLRSILDDLNISGVDGILLDLGLSLHQLRKSTRGFSFLKDEPLDMRMNTGSSLTAADLVNTLKEKELADLFFKYGEEPMSRRIARAVVAARTRAFLNSSKTLAEIVKHAVPVKKAVKMKIHPATRVFQALRIAVNKELDQLEAFLTHLPDYLNRGGRICVISFHSLEDRMVKHSFRSFEQGCTCPRDFPKCVCGFKQKLKLISRKPFMADKDEIYVNPMARSARMRVAERI
ncbi:MAG: 16S rRNA (cytosine(1402)-N(4))-methyltransferase RsmH [Desulfobacteraceae bacterium]